MPRYERISQFWPMEVLPDPSEREGYYQTRLDRRLPFSAEDPLLFHVLTTLDQFGEGEEQLLSMMERDVAIIPRIDAPEGKSMMFARDIVAGDDLYVFTTPCNVFSGHEERAKRNSAVAFDARWVASKNPIAFRVHDLESSYKEAETMAGDIETEIDIDDDDREEMSEEEWTAIYLEQREEHMAEAVREQLEGIAECGTQYDEDAALGLVLLYAELCGSFREPARPWVPDSDPKRVAIFDTALGLLPDCIEELEQQQRSLHWSEDLMVYDIIQKLADDWKELFGQPESPLASFPWQLFSAPSMVRPEVLVRGRLPLCEAMFYRDGQGRWLPVPVEVCEAGRAYRGRRM